MNGSNHFKYRLFAIIPLSLITAINLEGTVFAANAQMGQVDSFIRSVITALTGIAGLVATGFFVLGGFKYITSSGNPHNLEHAKRTIVFSALGLAIAIAAFVLSNIVTSLASSAFGG
ncbi:TrbC/VirB2 family protein [Patescibacteria group bacterium]|nr:TrbC/VirB2 family protein [Patescibacteria group bacterium]